MAEQICNSCWSAPHYAKGLCSRCYQRERTAKSRKPAAESSVEPAEYPYYPPYQPLPPIDPESKALATILRRKNEAWMQRWRAEQEPTKGQE